MTNLELLLRSLAEIGRLVSQELKALSRSPRLEVPSGSCTCRTSPRHAKSIQLLTLASSSGGSVIEFLCKGQRCLSPSVVCVQGSLSAALRLDILQILDEAVVLALGLAHAAWSRVRIEEGLLLQIVFFERF